MTMGAGQKWTPYDRTQDLLKALDELVPDGADRQTQAMLLRIAGVKHMIVHHIGVPTAGVRLTGTNSRSSLERALRRTRLATLDGSFDDRSIWHFDRPLQRAYGPDCIFGVPPRADPYDVLALAPAAASCASPAAIATRVANARAEHIVSAETFRAVPAAGIAIGVPVSNVEIESVENGHGFYTVVPPREQDVEIISVRPVPKGATGVALRMHSSSARRVYVQLYCPDQLNFLQASIDFGGSAQDVALNFRDFGAVGKPDLRRLRSIRFASTNTQATPVHMYAGSLRWLDRPASSSIPDYLSLAGNRWDKFYFGGDRNHVLFTPSARRAPVYATVDVGRDGVYDVVAHVQDANHNASLRASVDGRTGRCSKTGGTSDQTERLVRVLRLPLRRGSHLLALAYCGNPQGGNAGVGVRSLIVAGTAFGPPAFRTAGSVRVVDERPGAMRLSASGNYLVFTDSYDDRWSAIQGGVPLQHVVANGYANAWRIPNPNAGEVVLQFWPQRSFEFGIAVSLGLAAVCLVIIALTVFEPSAPVEKRSVVLEHASPE
jgi:hypothetical protein